MPACPTRFLPSALSVAGRTLTGWYVLDLDATIMPCTSKKEGAAGTYKGSFGHMPLAAWIANRRECVAMLLRPGNAPPNDIADYKTVLAAALRGLPLPPWSKLLVRIDGAAFSHGLLDHLQTLTTSWRRVRFVTGWAINTADEQAITLLPERRHCGRTADSTRSRGRTAGPSPTRSPRSPTCATSRAGRPGCG